MGFLGSIAAFFQEGGAFMYIILLVWFIGAGVGFIRMVALKVLDVDGASIMSEVQKKIFSNELKEAIKMCSGHRSLLPQIFKSGLKRINSSNEQIQNAIDATALEVIPKAEKWLSYLPLLANLSTLLGLLGTIFGLVQAFEAVGYADPAMKGQILASGISKAMNTTALGLMSAMTIMVMNAFLRAKANNIIAQIDEYSVKLMDLLQTRKATEG